jgi:succinyl-CoA synthetase beta subunit
MKIHEYQAKELFRQYGVACPDGYPAFTLPEAMDAARKLPGPIYVVKAQIHAGGRGDNIWYCFFSFYGYKENT